MSSVLWWARRPRRAAHRRTFHCRGPPRTSAPTSVQVYSVVRELLAVRFGDAQGGRDFTRNNFRTRVVCDVVCDLVGRDVLGAPRAWGRSAVAGRRGRRPLPAFRSTASFESCWPFGSGMPREEEISRGTTSVPGSFAMSSVIWRAVTSSARRAQKDVPLSRAAEDVGPYQRSGLQRRSRVVGRSVRECPGRKRFHAE